MLTVIGGGVAIAGLCLALAARGWAQPILHARAALGITLCTGLFLLVSSEAPLRAVRSHVPAPPGPPPGWMVFWALSKLGWTVAALLLAALAVAEKLAARGPGLALPALLLLLVLYAAWFLYGRTAANIAEIVRRWPRKG